MKRAVIKLMLSFVFLSSFNAYLLLAQESPFPSPKEGAHLKIEEHVLNQASLPIIKRILGSFSSLRTEITLI